MDKDPISIRIHGHDQIRPGLVPGKIAAVLIVSMEQMIAETAAALLDVEPSEVVVSPTIIRDKSYCVVFDTPGDRFSIAHEAMFFIMESIRDNCMERLPKKALSSLRSIQKMTTKLKGEAQISLEGLDYIAEISPTTEIPKFSAPAARGMTTLYGYLHGVYGKTKTSVRVDLIQGQRDLRCQVPEHLIEQVTQLYKHSVEMQGIAVWDARNYTVQEFKITGIKEFRKMPVTQAFDELRDLVGGAYDDIEDVEAYVRSLRSDDEEFFDNGNSES